MKKPIPGFEKYTIDTDGNIFNNKGKKLKPWGKRYDTVKLYKDGISYERQIHVLVLETFVGPRPKGYQAAHNDGDSRNNVLSNLRWATVVENQQDRLRHGTHNRGERGGLSKLNWIAVNDIRNKYSRGNCTHRSLAEEYNVTKSTITSVINNETWRKDAVHTY